MKKLTIISELALWVMGTPAQAQMDWLSPHLDAQRYNWQLRQNQKLAGKGGKRRKAAESGRARRARLEREQRRQASRPVVAQKYPVVHVNGREIKGAVPAMQVNGNTFVPFREIFEALGAQVSYNSQQRIITARRGVSQMQLSLPGGDTRKLIGKRQSVTSGETPFMHKGATMVPLRMVSEKMGAQVNCIDRAKTPLISILSREA